MEDIEEDINHMPTTYFVQGFRDPRYCTYTHAKGSDKNDGLSILTPLKTIREAMKRVHPYSGIMVRR